MTDHEGALIAALIAHLKGDTSLRALLGDPARIWDEAPEDAAFPHLIVGRCDSRPVAAADCGIEHRLTLSCASRFPGAEEARAVAAAVRARLEGATLNGDGARTVGLGVTFIDVFRSADRKRAWAVIRVRAVTEEV